MKKVSGEVLPLSTFVSAVTAEISVAYLLYIDRAWTFHLSSPSPQTLVLLTSAHLSYPAWGLPVVHSQTLVPCLWSC